MGLERVGGGGGGGGGGGVNKYLRVHQNQFNHNSRKYAIMIF